MPTAKSPKPARKSPVAKPAPQPAAKRVKSPTRTKASAAPIAPPPPVTSPLRPNSKQAQLLNLLGTGATMSQMEELTGWQPHTIRATLSAVFRKRLSLNVQAGFLPDSNTRHYRLVATSPA